MHWKTVLGRETDRIARAELKVILAGKQISEGPGTGVLVNRWLIDPLGSGARRVPDLRLDGSRLILDGTIGEKTVSSQQLMDMKQFSGGYNVRIVTQP
jgi:hypothetical protein